jgi:hypothetical protein
MARRSKQIEPGQNISISLSPHDPPQIFEFLNNQLNISRSIKHLISYHIAKYGTGNISNIFTVPPDATSTVSSAHFQPNLQPNMQHMQTEVSGPTVHSHMGKTENQMPIEDYEKSISEEEEEYFTIENPDLVFAPPTDKESEPTEESISSTAEQASQSAPKAQESQQQPKRRNRAQHLAY